MANTLPIKAIILLCFLVTGATGLVYELVWTRLLILTFGSTQFAITTVLTTFMAGLALGSILFGRLVDRFPYPLKVYGLIQCSIGAYCFLTPPVFEAIRTIYLSTFSVANISQASFSPLQFLLALMGIIVPTTLMGGTLPVLVKYFTQIRDKVGFETGLLYSVNTVGAVVGCFLTGSFFLYLLGVRETLYSAGAVDLLIGTVAISSSGFSRQRSPKRREEPTGPIPWEASKQGEEAVGTAPYPSLSSSTAMLVLAAFALSGFAALVYETLWFRIFSLILGSSIYAFTIMLSTFLAGLAAGSALFAGFIDRRQSPLLWFALLELIIGISVLLSIFLYRELPFIFLRMSAAFFDRFWLFLLLQSLLCASIMIIPTMCMGATFPTVSRSYTRSLSHVGKSIGDIYFFNTLGAIFGSFIAGFVLIPFIGVQKSILIMTLLNVLLGLILLLESRGSFSLKGSVAGVALIVFAALYLNVPDWNKKVMTWGPYVNPLSEERIEIYKKARGRYYDLIFYKEGINALITVRKSLDGETITYQANGKFEAKAVGSRPSGSWSILGHLPMILNEEAGEALLIGLGSGITLGAMAQYPVELIDVVEIEPAVIEAARYFSDANNDALNDPRVHVYVADGRNFLLTTSRKYDVIVSAVSDPWISGVSNLFTREYFELLRKRLKPDGTVALWFQNYRISVNDVKIGLNTFASVFPNVSLWFYYRETTDLVVVGTNGSHLPTMERILEKMSLEKVRKDLARVDIDDAWDLLNCFLLGNGDVRRYIEGADENEDNRNILEYTLPRLLYSRDPMAGSNERVLDMLEQSDKDFVPLILPDDRAEKASLYYKLGAEYARFVFRREQAARLFQKVLDMNPDHEGAKEYLERLQSAQ